jgi:uncharacterized membrane protein YoaK (UPF0700 family)
MSLLKIFARDAEDRRHRQKSIILHYLMDEDAHNIFAFIGGYVDSAGYMKLQGLFTSSITGNLIAATSSIYHTYGVVARIFVALFFAVGALFTSGILFKLKMHKQWSSKSLLIFGIAIEIVALVLTLLFGMLYEDEIDKDHSLGIWQLIFVASIMAFSMGAQCAYVKDSFPDCPSTTVITMLLVTFSSQGAQGWNYFLALNGWHTLLPSTEENADMVNEKLIQQHLETKKKFVSTTRQLASFLIGGLVGAAIMQNAAFWSLVVPVGILLLVIADVLLAKWIEKRTPKAMDTEELESRRENGTSADEIGDIEIAFVVKQEDFI